MSCVQRPAKAKAKRDGAAFNCAQRELSVPQSEFQYFGARGECVYTFAALRRHTREVMKLRHLIGLIAILIATL